jgi:hypothetical protein
MCTALERCRQRTISHLRRTTEHASRGSNRSNESDLAGDERDAEIVVRCFRVQADKFIKKHSQCTLPSSSVLRVRGLGEGVTCKAPVVLPNCPGLVNCSVASAGLLVVSHVRCPTVTARWPTILTIPSTFTRSTSSSSSSSCSSCTFCTNRIRFDMQSSFGASHLSF